MQTSQHYSPAPLREFPVVPALHEEAQHRAGPAPASFQPAQSSESTWWVYPVDGSKHPILVAGSLQDMVAHINSEHLATGIQYAARQTAQ